MLKRIAKILGITILLLLIIIGVGVILVTQNKVQNKLAKYAASYLSDKLKTKVTVDNVRIDFLNYVHLEGLYIEDQKKDTLMYIKDFSVKSSSVFSDYWNGKTTIINKVNLQGGVVNLNRSSNADIWNYAFIEEAFANDTKDSTQSDLPKLDLKNVNVQDVRFAMLDRWGGQDIEASLGKLNLKVNSVDLAKLVFNISSVDIAKTTFSFKDYEGGKPKVKQQLSDQSQWGTPFNTENVQVRLDNLDLTDVHFEYQMDNHISQPGLFDERHIVASNIQLQLEDLKIKGDTITTEIVDFRAQERCGLVVKKLKSRVKLNQQIAELDNLYLETNRSVVKNYYSMEYKNFHDFNNYIDEVKMYAQFRNSKVDKRDIAFFSGDVSQLPQFAQLNGRAEGTVDNIFVPKIKLSSKDLDFEGSAKITGLPDVDNTIFDLEAKRLITTGNEIIRIAPEAKTDGIAWDKLTRIDFAGKFIGKVNKFNADGVLKTNHGDAVVDMFMDLNGAKPNYKGSVKTTKFDIGAVLKQSELGIISVDGKIDGSGFDFENLNAKLDAYVSEVYVNNERYEKMTFIGSVNDKQFKGVAKSMDPKLGFDFNGNVNLSGAKPIYDFKSDILIVNLKTLGVTPNDVFLRAKVLLDFEGRNIDEFVGKAVMQEVNIRYEDREIYIPQLRLNSFYTDSLGKVLDLKSSVVDGRVVGRFTLTGIDKTIRSFLHYYIPTFIKEESLPENEIFDFDLLVKNANSIIQIYEPNLAVDSGSVIKGNINTSRQILNLNGLLPNITYNGLKLSEVGLESKGTGLLFSTKLLANKVWLNNSQIIGNAVLDLAMSSDTAHVKLATKSVDDFLGEALIDFKAQGFNDKLVFNLNPSTFIIKSDKYRLSSAYPIELREGSKLLAKQITIENGTQQLMLDAVHDGISNNATLDGINIDLEKISKYFNSKDFVFRGRLNTKISVNDIWDETKVSGNINSVDLLRVNVDTMGLANIDFEYDKLTNEVKIIKGSQLDYKKAFVKTDGKINLNEERLDINANLKNAPIGFANKFMDDLVDSLQGFATGDVKVKGSFNSPDIQGDLFVNDGKFKVLFTGCTYSVKDFDIQLSKKAITFDPITIYDQRRVPGQALLTGKITHEDYKTYKLKLNVTTDDLIGLNTDEISGELFYGFIPAKFNMNISGELDDITMDIAAKPLPNSKFYMPLSSSGDASTYDYITFRTLGRFQEEEKKKKSTASYFKMNLDIEATPDVLATIILDPNTGEKIEARGNGNISINVDLGNDIRMYNAFTVKEGVYQFNFRGLLPKDFELEEGGTIKWNGDPYKAELDMKAIYKTNVALYPLISSTVEQGSLDDNANTEIGLAKREEETHVIIDLTGPLSLPKIVFDIQQPNNRNIGSQGLVQLEKIRQNQNELIYQAGMILLFNSFKPSSGALNAGSLATTTVSSTASDMVGSALSPVLNNVINRLTGSQNFSLNLNYKNYSPDVTSADAVTRRNQVDIDFSASLFKDRFIIQAGNSLDFVNSGTQTGGSAFNYGGDFRGQYLLTHDGRYRLTAYRVSTFDYIQSRSVGRGGIGLIYKKTFNNWRDLFSGKNDSDKKANFPDPEEKKNEKTSFLKRKELPFMTALDSISDNNFLY